MNNICLAHKDLDGFVSAAVVKDVHPDTDIRLVNYSSPIPVTDEELYQLKGHGRCLYIVDFSVPDALMRGWFSILGRNIVWVDHHKSAKALEYVQGLLADALIDGDFDVNFAACALTWRWFHPHEEMPILVAHANDYDLWRFELENTREFAEGLRSLNQKVEEYPALLKLKQDDTRYKELCDRGRIILESKAVAIAEYVGDHGYPIQLTSGEKKFSALAVNIGGRDISMMGHYVVETLGYDVAYLYLEYKRGRNLVRKVSLRSNPEIFDCSVFAARYGGGGHPGAASMEVGI